MQWFSIVLIISVLSLMSYFAVSQKAIPKIQNYQNSQIIMNKIKITSTAFKSGEMIPKKYTCDGEGISPPISIENVPTETKSLAFIMDDPDAPISGGFTHWLRFDIDPANFIIREGADIGGVSGNNSAMKKEYVPPCPPSGTHRYFLKVYALDTKLNLPEGATKPEVESAITNHILDKTELMGIYKR